MAHEQNRVNVSVTILGKEFLVACAEDERDQLVASAAYLNDKISDIKNSGKIIGGERIAILAALNITSELLALKEEKNEFSSVIERIMKIRDKVESALIE